MIPEMEKGDKGFQSMPIAIGDPAPTFTLADQNGQSVRLADFIGKQHVVLFFYPKDETPGCIKEVCAFRDQYAVFRELGAAVLGISSDDVASHGRFAEHHALPFPLLSDADGKVRAAYGVSKTLGLLPGRETFVIDQNGIVRYRFSSQFRAEKHIDAALKILKSL